jgi:hypothetical protein
LISVVSDEEAQKMMAEDEKLKKAMEEAQLSSSAKVCRPWSMDVFKEVVRLIL